MRRTSLGAAMVGGLTLLLMAGASQAAIINLEATLDGAQANAGAGTGSAGTGSAVMTFDDITNLFSWDIEWSGLSGPLSVAHFHGPAGPGVNAGVKVGIPVLTSPSAGSATITDTQDVADLLGGLWYINLHTQLNPAGEIRGQVTQVVPLPGGWALLALGIAALGVLRRR